MKIEKKDLKLNFNMNKKKFLPPEEDPRNASYHFKDIFVDKVENSKIFNTYINNNKIKKEFTGMLWSEGPCYIPSKEILVWSDIPNNKIMQLHKGKVSDFKNPSNYCNGNTLDNEENLISCSHGGRCIYKTDKDKNRSIVVDRYIEKKFNSPNDLCVNSDGSIWFTDPPYGISSDYEGNLGIQEYGGSYVFRYNPKINKLDVITRELNRPNGITFSLDEKKIYISDTGDNIKCLYSFDVLDNLITNKKLIYDFKPFFSDGFRCDIDGNIWTSAGKAIKCFNSNDELIGQLLIPELVSNLEFGGKEGNILYITATSSLYSIQLNQVGIKFKK